MMTTEPSQKKNVDEALDEIDWEKLDVEGAEDKAEVALPATAEPPLPVEKRPPPPAQVELFQRGSEIEIVRKWFGWQTVILTVFAGVWNGVIFAGPGAFTEDMPPLFALLFAVAGVCLAYYAIALWVNRTRIIVSRDKIAVRHGPLPWVGNKEVETANLKQVRAREQEFQNRRGVSLYRIHQVCAEWDDRSETLIGDCFDNPTDAQALFISEEIEKYFGIERTFAKRARAAGRIFAPLPEEQDEEL